MIDRDLAMGCQHEAFSQTKEANGL